uniref:hypothetical protein n=1 Tax=Agathobacter sp. TaxID=2021311 RepID=UPI00405734D4
MCDKMEDVKIEKVLEEFKEFFDIGDADICRSCKDGLWFFFRKDLIADEFSVFYHFKTADELKTIILNEIAIDIICGIGQVSDKIEVNYEETNKTNIAEIVEDTAYFENRNILLDLRNAIDGMLETCQKVEDVYAGLTEIKAGMQKSKIRY